MGSVGGDVATVARCVPRVKAPNLVEKTLESYPASKPARSHKAAVCVRPIFGPYDNLNQVHLFSIIIIIMVTFHF